MRKFMVLLLVVFLGHPGSAEDVATSDPRVAGVTEFLLDRIQANYFFVLERQMSVPNQILKTYFPRTAETLRVSSLTNLLRNSALWNDVILDDLGTFPLRVYSDYAISIATDFKTRLLKDYLVDATVEDIARALASDLVADDDETSTHIVQLVSKMRTKSLSLSALATALKGWKKSSKIWTTDIDQMFVESPEATNEKELVLNTINSFPTKEGSLSSLLIKQGFFLHDLAEERKIEIVEKLGKTVKDFRSFKQALSGKDSLVSKTIRAINFITNFRFTTTTGEVAEPSEFKTFKKYAILLAQLAEANGSSTVTKILQSEALPAVGFQAKRQANSNFLVGSFSAFALSAEIATCPELLVNDVSVAIPVLIDLEIAVPLKGAGVITGLIAPLDFTKPILAKIEESRNEISYTDIFAVTYGLLYGFQDIPVEIGVLYRDDRKKGWGKNLEVAIGFDMPILPLAGF